MLSVQNMIMGQKFCKMLKLEWTSGIWPNEAFPIVRTSNKSEPCLNYALPIFLRHKKRYFNVKFQIKCSIFHFFDK